MIALKITDLRDFTNKLFIREVFDSFWLNQAEITTYNTFSIDGKLHTDFQHIYSRQTSVTVMGRYGTGLFFPASNHI